MREEIKKRLDLSLLHLYENGFCSVYYPVQPQKMMEKLHNCRYITYREISAASGKSLNEVIKACNSADGCTNYDPLLDRYLVAVNTEGRNSGRIRWTTAHELGHILAGHFIELALAGRHEASPSELVYMEREADYFAANFLAPFQAIKTLHALTAADVRDLFGISQTAAECRWEEYIKPHEETALDRYLKWSGVQSSLRRKISHKKYYPIDVWADELM